MAIIKNIFRRKKRLADADGNQDSSDEDGNFYGDEVKRQEEEEARKTDNSSTSDLFAGVADDLEVETTEKGGAALLQGSKKDTAPVAHTGVTESAGGGDGEDFGFEMQIEIPKETPREARRRASSRDRGSRSRVRSSSKDALRAVRTRSQERRTKRGGKDGLGSSRHDSLASSRHSKEGIDTSTSSLKGVPATFEVSAPSTDSTNKSALSTSRHSLTSSRHTEASDQRSRSSDRRGSTGEPQRARNRCRDAMSRSSGHKVRSRSSDRLTTTSSSGDRIRGSSGEPRRNRRGDRATATKVEVEENASKETTEKAVAQGGEAAESQQSEDAKKDIRTRSSSSERRRPRRKDRETPDKVEAEGTSTQEPVGKEVVPNAEAVAHGEDATNSQKTDEVKKDMPSSSAATPTPEAERRRARRSTSRDPTLSRRSDSKDRSSKNRSSSKERSGSSRSSSRDGRRPRSSQDDHAVSSGGAENTSESAPPRRSSSRDRRPRRSGRKATDDSSGGVESGNKEADAVVNEPASDSKAEDQEKPNVEAEEQIQEQEQGQKIQVIFHDEEERKPPEAKEVEKHVSENGPPQRSSSTERRETDRRARRARIKAAGDNSGGVEPGNQEADIAVKEPTSNPKAEDKEQPKAEAKGQVQEQEQGQTTQVVFHEDEERKAIEAKNAEEKLELVVEINPALALLSHLGGDDSKTLTSEPLSDPYAELLKSCMEEGQQENTAKSPSSDASRGIQEDDSPTSDRDEASDIDSVKFKLDDASDIDSVRKRDEASDSDSVLQTEETSTAKKVETIAEKEGDEVVEVEKSSAEVRVERRSKRPEKNKLPAKNDNPAADLLGFLGSNYDDIINNDQTNSAPTAFDLCADQPEDSVDFYKGISASAGTGQSGENGGGGDDYVKDSDRFNDSFGEGEKRLPPPSVAPTAIVETEKQKARRARRISRRTKVESGDTEATASALAPPSLAGDMHRLMKPRKPKGTGEGEANGSALAAPSLAGDMHKLMRPRKPKTTSDEAETRGIGRSKSDEGPVLHSMVDEDEEVKKPQSMRRKILRATGIDGKDSGDDEVVEEDTRRKVTRKEVRKASKFASLDDDDDDDDDAVEIVVTEAAPTEKPKNRRGLLSRATSVTNVIEKTTKRAAKKVASKAASTRNLFK